MTTTVETTTLMRTSLDKMSHADREQAITKIGLALTAIRDAIDALGPTDVGCDVQQELRYAVTSARRAHTLALGQSGVPAWRWAWDMKPRSGRR